MKVAVKKLCGTKREVADMARTTIGLKGGEKEVSDEYMRKMYLCEHSPSRTEMYKITFKDIPYWVAMHFCRHKIGVEHFVSTQRTDRTGENRDSKSQDAPVLYEMVLNAQAIINISRRRLCSCASKETKQAWKSALSELGKINMPLVSCCAAECIYKGHCFEYKTCNFHKTDKYKELLEKYRKDINK